jgi:hypothetical protein
MNPEAIFLSSLYFITLIITIAGFGFVNNLFAEVYPFFGYSTWKSLTLLLQISIGVFFIIKQLKKDLTIKK